MFVGGLLLFIAALVSASATSGAGFAQANLRLSDTKNVQNPGTVGKVLRGMDLSKEYKIPINFLVVFKPDFEHEAAKYEIANFVSANGSFNPASTPSITMLRQCAMAIVSFQPDARIDDIWTVVQYLENLDAVMDVENDEIVTLDPVRDVSEISNWPLSTVPNDPLWSLMWGLVNIKGPEAWDIATGAGGGAYSPVISVIDTGVDYDHPDIASNIWVNEAELNGIEGVDDDGNGYIDDIHGWNAFGNNGDPKDEHWHGTHVSGTIGATTNNGRGVAGINWAPKIQACKFMNENAWGTTAGAVTCINYALATNAWLSNNSWGSGGYSSTLYMAIQRARDAGHIFVAAAGNNGQNSNEVPFYPASYQLENVVAVAAINQSDYLASFSNYGDYGAYIAAPGVSIASVYPNSRYAYASGTSMAAPHVSGALALMKSLKPSLTSTEAIRVLKESVKPFPGDSLVRWEGKLDLYEAMQRLSSMPTTTTSTTTKTTTSTTTKTTTTTTTTTTTMTTTTTTVPVQYGIISAGTMTCSQGCQMRHRACNEAATFAVNTNLDACYQTAQAVDTSTRSYSRGRVRSFGAHYPTGCYVTYWKGTYQMDLNTFTQGTGHRGCDAPAATVADAFKLCVCGASQ